VAYRDGAGRRAGETGRARGFANLAERSHLR
jgi:hypothetical protein